MREKVKNLSYPSGVMRMINGEITGKGFFPGAKGTSDCSTSISNKKVMVLGQDQDNEAGYQKSKNKGEETYSPTWKNLELVLSTAGIKLSDCFFTNCIMGVRVAEKNTGKSPALAYPDFIGECMTLLKEQISLQKPDLIICLGMIPIKLLGLLSKYILARFITIESYSEIDSYGLSLLRQFNFDNLGDFSTTVAVIVHPSFRHINQKFRKYSSNGYQWEGEKAELELLKDALTK